MYQICHRRELLHLTYQPDLAVNFFLKKCNGIRFLMYWSRRVGFQLPNSLLLMISGAPRKHYVYGGQVKRPRHICFASPLLQQNHICSSKQSTISFGQLLVTVTSFTLHKQRLVVFFRSHRATLAPQL